MVPTYIASVLNKELPRDFSVFVPRANLDEGKSGKRRSVVDLPQCSRVQKAVKLRSYRNSGYAV